MVRRMVNRERAVVARYRKLNQEFEGLVVGGLMLAPFAIYLLVEAVEAVVSL